MQIFRAGTRPASQACTRCFTCGSARAHATHSPAMSSPHAACTTAAPTPSHLLARISPSQHASLWTRQNADAFNQPLSLDTSKVTDMQYMFQVRLRACPILHLDGPHTLTCALQASAPPPSLHVALFPRLPLDSAVGDGVQPAAEFRHVQRHKHGPDVLRAASHVPLPPLCSCLRCRRLRTLVSLPQRTSPSDLAGRIVFV